MEGCWPVKAALWVSGLLFLVRFQGPRVFIASGGGSLLASQHPMRPGSCALLSQLSLPLPQGQPVGRLPPNPQQPHPRL